MAATRSEPLLPAGAFALTIRTLTGGTTTLRDVVSSQTVGSVTLRLCVETGGEPALTRLLREQKPLADRKRALLERLHMRSAPPPAAPPVRPRGPTITKKEYRAAAKGKQQTATPPPAAARRYRRNSITSSEKKRRKHVEILRSTFFFRSNALHCTQLRPGCSCPAECSAVS